jgi:hypothetical protein
MNKFTACGRLAGAVFLLEMTKIITKEGECEIEATHSQKVSQ